MSEQLIAASPDIQGQQSEIQSFVQSEITATQAQIEDTNAQRVALSAVPDRTTAQDAQLAALDNRLTSLHATLAALLALTSADASNLLTVIEPAIARLSRNGPTTFVSSTLDDWRAIRMADLHYWHRGEAQLAANGRKGRRMACVLDAGGAALISASAGKNKSYITLRTTKTSKSPAVPKS